MKLLTQNQAVLALKAGKAVVMATDTVFGVGVAVGYAPSPSVLFDAKGRSTAKPVAWLVSSPKDLAYYGASVPAYALCLGNKFWPGALTLVVSAGPLVPLAYQSQQGTLGLRMPNNEDVLALIETLGCPLAVTSANFSGKPAPQTINELDESFIARTAGVYSPSAETLPTVPDVSTPSLALASTVLDCTGKVPHILREGPLSIDDLRAGDADLPFS